MMRAFNAREGFGRDQDRLPAKVLLPKVGGASDGVAVPLDEVESAKDYYYQLAGWDVSTGNPTSETLDRLELGWIAGT